MLARIVFLVTAVLAPTLSMGQVRDPARPATATDPDTAILARGWTDLAAGRAEAALTITDRLLQDQPWNHAAFVLRIDALTMLDPSRALEAYEHWLGRNRPDDSGLLAPIAGGVLQRIALGVDQELALAALDHLVRARVGWAAAALAARRQGGPTDTVTIDGALARSGDPQALARLNEAAMQPQIRSAAKLVEALASAGERGVPGLMRLASTGPAPARGAALTALGDINSPMARGTLERAAQDTDPFIRTTATVALARQGDEDARRRVQDLLASEVPELRLMAAEAGVGQDGPWVAAVMPLLENPDGLIRFQAARLIGPVDPAAAQRVWTAGLADPNPVVRAESAQLAGAVVERAGASAALAPLRAALKDADPAVRLHAAGAILAVARARHAQPRP